MKGKARTQSILRQASEMNLVQRGTLPQDEGEYEKPCGACKSQEMVKIGSPPQGYKLKYALIVYQSVSM